MADVDTRAEWERALMKFLIAPPAPKPKGAEAHRVTPRRFEPAGCRQR